MAKRAQRVLLYRHSIAGLSQNKLLPGYPRVSGTHPPFWPLTLVRTRKKYTTAGVGQPASPLASTRVRASVPLQSAPLSFALPQRLDLVWHLDSHAPPTLRTTCMTEQSPEQRPDRCHMRARDNTEQLPNLDPQRAEPTLLPRHSSAAHPDH